MNNFIQKINSIYRSFDLSIASEMKNKKGRPFGSPLYFTVYFFLNYFAFRIYHLSLLISYGSVRVWGNAK